MINIRIILTTALVAVLAHSASATTEDDLRDTWVNAFPTNQTNDMLGSVKWTTVTFSSNRSISWTWEREGKTESHRGRYTLQPEPSETEFEKNTSVVIIPTTLAVRRPLVLKEVEVDLDSRFPVKWTVLKCKDVGDQPLVFLRKRNDTNGEQAGPGYPPQGVGSPDP